MSAMSVGQIGLDLVVNQNQFKSQMAGIQNIAKKAGATLAAAFGVKKIVDFGKQCLKLGSDLAEVQNVVDVVFPSMTAQVDKFARAAAKNFGLSETMAKQYTGLFGSMAKSFGFSESAAYDMGTTLAGLAGDVASFYNISQDEAYTKLKSVFSGETETLKDLGIVMTQSALDSYALANGFDKTTSAMSEAEKVALRYQFVQEQLSAASGDFARTSGSWANQIKILQLQMQSFMATVGQGLINLFTPVIKIINTVIGKLMTLANAFKSFTELITGNKSSTSGSDGIAAVTGAASEAGTGLESASDAADSLNKSTEGVGNAAKKAAKEMKALMGFDKINKLDAQTDADSTGSTGNSVGAGDIGFGSLPAGETIIDNVNDQFTKMFENILKYTEPTTKALKKLYNEGLSKLGNFTFGALKGFYQEFLVPVGKWVMGKGLPEFINVLNDGLMKINFDKIRTALNNLWKALAPFTIKMGEGLLWFWEKVLVPLGTWTANEVIPRFLSTLTSAIKIADSTITALQPSFQWFWDKVLQPLAQWAGGVFLTVWDGINSTLQKFADWCSANPEIIQTAAIAVTSFFAAWKVTELLAFIQQAGGVIGALKAIETALLGNIATKLIDKAETMYLTALYAKDFVISVGESVIALGKQALSIAATTAAKAADVVAQIAMTAAVGAWNVVCGIAEGVTAAFGAAVAFLTSPIGIAVAAIGTAIAAGVLLYKNWDTVCKKATQLKDWIISKFSAVNNWFGNTFSKDWTKNFGAFGNVLNAFFKNVSNVTGDIKKIFSGIITFVSGVFHNDWEKAWDGIRETFEGVFQGLADIAKTPLNAIIGAFNGVLDVVNGLIGRINSIRFTINKPSWMGGGSWGFNGFNIPTIGSVPYLAQGGYVKPNTPQLAMIGDNLHQGEIVAPENKLKEMAMAAVQAAGSGVSKDELESIINRAVMRIIAALADMGFYLDSEQVGRATRAAQAAADRRFNAVEVG